MSENNKNELTQHEKDLLNERSLYNKNQSIHYKPEVGANEKINLEFSKLSNGESADYTNTNCNNNNQYNNLIDAQLKELNK